MAAVVGDVPGNNAGVWVAPTGGVHPSRGWNVVPSLALKEGAGHQALGRMCFRVLR